MINEPHAARRPHPGNFVYLFAALLVFAVGAPVLEVSLPTLGGLFAEVSLSLTLVIALWSLRASRPVFVAGLVLIAVNVVATVVWLLAGRGVADVAAHLSGLAFLALAAAVALRAIFLPGPVDLNKVTGSLCVYLLIGIAWAELYQLLHAYDPSSFAGVEQQQGHALSWRFLYFSFVTLTTLGYGDVLPLTIYAQTLTAMETVIGQFYLAVLVAVLVSAYLSDTRGDTDAAATDETGNRTGVSPIPEGAALHMQPSATAGSPALGREP